MLLSIDPGKDKCGLAVLDHSKNVLERKIISPKELINVIPFYLSKYDISVIVVGKSAFGKDLSRDILKLELRTNVIFVSEKNTTLEARKRYWQENKPKGILRFFPTSLRVPPVPIDDYAAVILGERYLKG